MRSGAPLDSRAPLLALTALAAVAFAMVLYAGRRMGFYFDEWNFVLDRRGLSADVLLRPHNEHVSVMPVATYKALFETVGLSHHWPYRGLLAVLHVACGLATYVLARRRLGAWAALLPATLVLFLGLAHDNMVFAFQIGFVGSVLGGLLAWIALDRGGRCSDALACLALVFATSCSSLGVPLALGVAVELLLARRRRALWVAGVPLVLYGGWYLGYGVGTITGEGVLHMAPWAAAAATAAAGATVGLASAWGAVILVGFVVAIGWRLAVGDFSPRLIGLITAAVAFWLLTGAARSVGATQAPAASSRYMTLGAVIFVLLAAELLRGVPQPLRVRREVVAYAAAVTLAVVAMGYPSLHDYARNIGKITGVTAAELGGLELVADYVSPDYVPDAENMPQVSAGPYLEAVRVYGSSPARRPEELAEGTEREREQADRVIVQFGLPATAATTAPPAGSPPAVDRAMGGRVGDRDGCVTFTPAAPGGALAVTVPATGVVVRPSGPAPVQIAARRFADGFGPTIATATHEAPLRLVPRRDGAAGRPYHVQATTDGPMAVCGAGA
jgi:hypothetical protein